MINILEMKSARGKGPVVRIALFTALFGALISVTMPAIANSASSSTLSGPKSGKNPGFFSRITNALGFGEEAEKNQTQSPSEKYGPFRQSVPSSGEAELDLAETEFFLKAQTKMEKNPPVPNIRPLTAGTLPISDKNAELYKHIFQLQENGNWEEADGLSRKLTDMRLQGHVLYQRYMHPTAYKSSFSELKSWLDLYADHPGAGDVYKLAISRKPVGYKGHIKSPKMGGKIQGVMADIHQSSQAYKPAKKQSYARRMAIRKLDSKIRSLNRQGAPTRALAALKASKAVSYMDNGQHDRMLGRIARAYYHAGKLDKAYTMSKKAADRSGEISPVAGWIAGLTSWRKGEYKQAARYFEMTGDSKYAGGWTSSAGSYWAARAQMASSNFSKVSPWLNKAAEHKRTFYGMIAAKGLGKKIDLNWSASDFSQKHRTTLKFHKAGWRALALIELGEVEKAEAELIHLNPGRRNTELREALVAFSQNYRLPALSMRLGHAYTDTQGRIHEAALYPLMSWEPRSGYKLDRALIHAFIRQESRFEIEAKSHRGATGLMQLMLRTASYVDGQQTFSAHNRHLLENPSTNLDLGQKYIKSLLGQKHVAGDLLSLAIAYNAGPGNLAKWKQDEELVADPLLFIESIPLAETRAFVERVLSNYWIYRMRFEQDTPSLDNIAEDTWPIYVAQDADTTRVASVE